MINCCKCIHFFEDWSVGYIDCKVVEKLPDDIYEDYEEQFPEMFVCPYYEEQEDYDYPSEETYDDSPLPPDTD